MPLLKSVCCACDKSDARCLAGTDVNIARDFLGIACDFVFRSHRECQNLLCTVAEENTVLGKCDATCAANYELLAETFLHLAQLARKCGLRDMKRLRRSRDALGASDGQKVVEDAQIKHMIALPFRVYVYYYTLEMDNKKVFIICRFVNHKERGRAREIPWRA